MAVVNVLFEATRAVIALNAVLLLALIVVWGQNYRSHGAKHTLGLLIFAVLLFAQNALSMYFLTIHEGFRTLIYWSSPVSRQAMLVVYTLQLLALAFLVRITWE